MALAEVVGPVSSLAVDDVVPVPLPLHELFPYGGPVRGSLVAVEGSTTVALTLFATASAAGSWAAVVGIPTLGLAAVAELGIDLTRFAVVPAPGEQWMRTVAALVEGVGLVVLAPPRGVRAGEARKVAARVRDQRALLVVTGAWPEPVDLRIRLEANEWGGAEHGHGRLTGRRTVLAASGRGAAARERRVTTWLPLAP